MKKLSGFILFIFLLCTTPLFAQRTAIFPRLASGAGWTSQFFFTNQGTAVVENIRMEFVAYNQSWSRVDVETNLGTGQVFTFDLQAGGTQAVRVTSGSEFVQGYVLVDYPFFDDPIRASQVFRNEEGGVVTTEVGVPQQELGDHFSFPVEIDPVNHVYPAVVLSNWMSFEQTLVVNLINSDGSVRNTKTVTMQPGQHRVGYLDQNWLFPGLNNTAFIGSVSISSAYGIGVLTLRQDKNAFGGIGTDGGPIIGPFKFTGTSVAETEPNDDLSDAQPITGSTIVTGAISVAYDQDLFYFYGTQGQIVTIFSETGGDSRLDSVLAVYDSDGDPQLAYNDQNGLAPGLYPQYDSFIQMVLPAIRFRRRMGKRVLLLQPRSFKSDCVSLLL